MPFILGRKLDMTQVFRDDGTVVPVTRVQALPNIVTQVRTAQRDGYVAVQLGTDETRRALSKSKQGHLKDLPAVKMLKEVRVPETSLVRGDTLTVADFKEGMRVDVTGVSKGRGFAGVMKRHGFAGGPGSHGNKDQHRMPGSVGSQRQGPVIPGQRMAGHMGAAQVTVKNLEIVCVNEQAAELLIKGAVPGPRNGLVVVRSRDSKHVWQS